MEMRLQPFGVGDFFFPFNEKVNSLIMVVLKETQKRGATLFIFRHTNNKREALLHGLGLYDIRAPV